ncbi:MAG TPA: trypsin-like peptidase domain-containing protein [Blastocatellia bacterium]|nr:trypsin-like peptidase domain-containing protein [Blastocatellia bacterium]
MNLRIKPARNDQAENVPASHHKRVVLALVAMCCISIGVAIGAIARGLVGAASEDNRLTISNTPVTPDALSAAFARVAEMVEPSVVHIKVYESEIYAREGAGSGVIVNPAGYILTNQHVIGRAIKIKVKLYNGNEYDAKVIGQDSGTDLAVIKIEAREPLTVARFGDSDKLKVGDWVLAIGSPFGLEQTVTAGIISAKDRVADSNKQSAFQQFLQTDAAINPGNSGGPLVNLAGEVVGINTQIATNSGFNNGIGLALPSSTIADIYNQLVTNGRVRRGFLGISPIEMTPQIARLNKITDGSGVVIRDLTSETSPAARAGLQSGDIVTAINGQKVKNVRELIRRIASLPVGSTATISYVRGGEPRTAQVKLEERQDEDENQPDLKRLPFDPRKPLEKEGSKSSNPNQKPALGINVRALTADLAKLHGLEGAKGAYVTSVDPGSVADDNDVRMDDLIVEMNNRPITSQEDFQRIVRELKPGDDVVIKVLRKDRSPVRRSWIISFTMP